MTKARISPGWRLLLVPPRSGAENMARDVALMDRARSSGESVFSVYEWEVPTLSLGRNQSARNRYDEDAIFERGIEVVRRPTGGRALLHHREVTYSVTAPVSNDESLRGSYARINRILMDGLSRLGVKTVEADVTERTPSPGDLPCFAAPTAGELVTDGAKLVGSAQVREDGALLQHGSILVEDDQSLIAELLADEAKVPSAPAATLRHLLRRSPTANEVANALFDSVRVLEYSRARIMDEAELTDATAHHMERFASKWWTWRR